MRPKGESRPKVQHEPKHPSPAVPLRSGKSLPPAAGPPLHRRGVAAPGSAAGTRELVLKARAPARLAPCRKLHVIRGRLIKRLKIIRHESKPVYTAERGSPRQDTHPLLFRYGLSAGWRQQTDLRSIGGGSCSPRTRSGGERWGILTVVAEERSLSLTTFPPYSPRETEKGNTHPLCSGGG